MCWESLGHLVSPPVQVNSTDCTFCLFPPPLGAAFGVQEAMCCCHRELPQFCDHGESQICIFALHKDLGFMFMSLNRNQTQQSQLRNGRPPRVWWHTCCDQRRSLLFLEEKRRDWKGLFVPQDKTDFPKSLFCSSPVWEVPECWGQSRWLHVQD